MKSAIPLLLLVLIAGTIGCNHAPSTISTDKPYTLPPPALTLDAHATRTDDGRVVISGRTNLPDGLRLWIEVENGHLPLGSAKVAASDDAVIVKNGQFTSFPLWFSVPNTRFTKKGWPKGIHVDDRSQPFPVSKYKVHFVSHFNGAWQTSEVLKSLGDKDGKNLNGPILSLTNPDVIDSSKIVDYRLTLPFPPTSPGANAINLVRAAVLTVPTKGRSAGDVQANIDLFISMPGLKAAKEWSAQAKSPTVYEVSYDFVNGDLGEAQAIWQANIATGEVKYINENGKLFSWTPSY